MPSEIIVGNICRLCATVTDSVSGTKSAAGTTAISLLRGASGEDAETRQNITETEREEPDGVS